MKNKLTLLLMRGIGLLPLGPNRVLGSLTGQIAWFFGQRVGARNNLVTLENLRRCYPNKTEEEVHRLAKASVIETMKLVFEVLWVWRIRLTSLEQKIVNIENEALVVEAMARNKGLVILAPHIGNWEVVGRLLNKYGDVTCLYKPPKYTFLEGLVRKSREQDGGTLVPTTTRGVAKLLAALKKGAITGILPDQYPDINSGELSTFFGCPAFTMTLVHGLITRTDCSVLTAVAERVDGGFVFRFAKADDDIFSEDQATSLLGMNRSVEACVNVCPEQYQWEYKRFKRTGEGASIPYQFKK